MQSNAPMVKLGEVLTLSKVSVTIDPLSIYKQVTVRLFHKGLTLREEKIGQEIQSNQWLVKKDQFVISRIDARNGAMGIVPPELDGAVVTNDFLRYDIAPEQLDIKFFDFLTSTETFVHRCAQASEGTTNRKRLRPDLFLNIDISLPPLKEQQRIVTTIEQLMANIEEARRERKRAMFDLLSMANGYKNILFTELYHEFEKSPLSQNADVAMGQSPAGTSYNELGIGYPLLNGPTEFGDEYPTQIQWTSESTKICKPGDLLICVRGATTGKMNWADKEYCIGRGLAAITSKAERCDKKYLRYFIEFQTQKILSDARGSTFPNLPGEKLKKVLVPIPPLPEQHRIVAHLDRLQAKVDEVKRLQEETEREMAALVPAVLAMAFN